MNIFRFLEFLSIILIARANRKAQIPIPLKNESDVYKEWKNLDLQIKNSINSVIKMAYPVAAEITSSLNLTDDCKQQGFHLLLGVRKLKLWALSFVDASGKMIDGLLSGTASSPGNYDQCLNSVVTRSGDNGQNSRVFFRGKYCMVELKPPARLLPYMDHDHDENFTKSVSDITNFLISLPSNPENRYVHIALCVPSGCSNDDMEQLAEYANVRLPLEVNIRNCEVRRSGWPRDAVIIACCLGCVALLVCIGTFIKFYTSRHEMPLKSMGVKIIIAFSLQKNVGKLFDVKKHGKLPCLEGIRFLSMLWILGLHSYVLSIYNFYMNANALQLLDYSSQFLNQGLINGFIAVDVFFFIGGLVNYYSRVSEPELKRKKTNVLVRMRHRLFRILPVYAFSIIIGLLMLRISSGPHTYAGSILSQSCSESWWKNILFINNFQLIENICLPNSWYLSADMQFFVIALFTIPVLLKWPKIGIILNALLVLCSMLYSGIYSGINKVPATYIYGDLTKAWTFRKEYARPFGHAGPYFIGILTGHFIYEKKSLKMPLKIKILLWSLSTIFCLSTVFGTIKWNRDMNVTYMENVLYSIFYREVFVIGIAIVVVCCSTGNGGIVNSILSGKIWIPLSRLNLVIFLLSPVIQEISILSSRTLQDASYFALIRSFVFDSIISIVVAAILFTLVENPFTSVERILFPPQEKKESNTEKQVHTEPASEGVHLDLGFQKQASAINEKKQTA